ncbi:MAG: ABC transporter permease [Firmicutes bacterium]|nr:ABC transporter permease [Bacillota bacterium]
MNMRGYLLRKFIQALITVFIVIFMNFFLFRIMPGDPIRVLIRNPRISAGALERVRDQFGLNESRLVQFWIYLRDLFSGDLGTSFNYRQPVLDIVMERVPATVLLIGTATVLSIIIGVLLGVIFAWKRGTRIDIIGLSFSLILYSMPTFWVAIIMVMIFAVYWQIFPLGGMGMPGAFYSSYWVELASQLRYMFLPTITFALILIGEYVLIMRSSLLEVMREDYMLTARAKGVTNRNMLFRHAMPNAMLPVVTLIAINLGFIVGGAIQIETVFSWPGLGRLMYSALTNRDYPVLQGLFLFITIAVIGANFCADLLYRYLDPRVKS